MARRALLASVLAAIGFGAARAAPSDRTASPAGPSAREPGESRLSYEQSIARLREAGLLPSDVAPRLPKRMPRYDDEESLGLEFFRTELGDEDLSNLTLPRTFFGRSSLERVSFRNTDLSESSLCWNDLTDVDFTGASLARCDIRASDLADVDFRHADLSGADLRHSSFEGCRFDDARMDGAVLVRGQLPANAISPQQAAVIRWAKDAGAEPDGG